jgi:hypothetical protein
MTGSTTIVNSAPGTTSAIGRQHAAPMPPAASALRVTGTLTSAARIGTTSGATPTVLLMLDFSPARGLPYIASVKLGTSPADHAATEGMLRDMRAGTVVSVAAAALELQMDHGHAALRLVDAHTVWVLQDPIDSQPEADPTQPGLFAPAQH